MLLLVFLELCKYDNDFYCEKKLSYCVYHLKDIPKRKSKICIWYNKIIVDSHLSENL